MTVDSSVVSSATDVAVSSRVLDSTSSVAVRVGSFSTSAAAPIPMSAVGAGKGARSTGRRRQRSFLTRTGVSALSAARALPLPG